MKQEFFTFLPSEIIIDILSRLPVRTILSCKCVCKQWLSLLETDEFARSHLSKSVPGLAVYGLGSCNILEFEDVLDLEHHELQCIPVIEFNIPLDLRIHGSANGLLLLCDKLPSSEEYNEPDGVYILNPITREFIQIPCPQIFAFENLQLSTYGFGTARISGQHKIVRVFILCESYEETEAMIFRSCECQVYTLGTGSWRQITPGPELEYDSYFFGAFLNGNLHWLVFDLNGCPLISCFDLEDELFSTFPSPPALPEPIPSRICLELFALEDCLGLRDSATDDEVVIWLMKDYGDKKSWMKAFVISRSHIEDYIIADLIKVYKDGLIAWGDSCLFYYSSKTKTAREITNFENGTILSQQSILLTSSFVSLRCFVKEKVNIVEIF